MLLVRVFHSVVWFAYDKDLQNENVLSMDAEKRIASHSHGKRGGSRALVATNLGDRWFFVFGFAKNERSDLSARELRALKALAADLLQYSDQELQKAHISKVLKEITYGNH